VKSKTRLGVLFLLCILVFSPLEKGYPLGDQGKAVLYNINFGMIVGGAGALINKPDGVKWYRALLIGCIQGACGGFLMYEGKNIAYMINSTGNLGYGWLAKIIHATGVSFVENASAGKYIWESWNMHVGPVRFETVPLEGSLRLRFLPYATGTLIAAACMADFHPVESLKCGTPYFGYNTAAGGGSMGNELMVNYGSTDIKRTVTHEYIHVFQQREWTTLNNFFLPVDNRLRTYPVFDKVSRYVYFDIPYFYPAYLAEGRRDINDSHYYDNYFEMEAEGFAGNFDR